RDDLVTGVQTCALPISAQIGIWSYMLVRGELDAAGVVLEPLTASVDAPETAWFAPEIRTSIGFHALYRGELESARPWLEDAWAEIGRASCRERVAVVGG